MNVFRLLSVAVVSVLVASVAEAKNFDLKDVKGKFSFFLNASGTLAASNATATAQSVNRVGMFDSDGKGAITGRAIAVVDDGTAIVVVDYNWTGTYTINDDGTGTITINAVAPGDVKSCKDGNGVIVGGCHEAFGEEHYAFVAVAGKQFTTLTLIQTDAPQTPSRMFLRGSATTQDVNGRGLGGSSFPF